MATHRFIQYIAPSKNKLLPTVHLRCHVKPGAAKVREGVTSLGEEAVELCVAAPAREGESNKAVLAVLSKVSETETHTHIYTYTHTHTIYYIYYPPLHKGVYMHTCIHTPRDNIQEF